MGEDFGAVPGEGRLRLRHLCSSVLIPFFLDHLFIHLFSYFGELKLARRSLGPWDKSPEQKQLCPST